MLNRRRMSFDAIARTILAIPEADVGRIPAGKARKVAGGGVLVEWRMPGRNGRLLRVEHGPLGTFVERFDGKTCWCYQVLPYNFDELLRCDLINRVRAGIDWLIGQPEQGGPP